ncbi:hypothetical protein E2P81_ATG01424 [Venturia nashicola]|uniref:Uncharacterized protein n=1 Tax=Venturia nashicola TaxID=86259 RepID=A0A4Z1PH10_9PEZI|nr:hypothetical protein E6O75_ATG01457 [Venturia nashicola]TLD38881.1 hypothetical protein E2P81_ATG01424 [Venturia nashicola]
MKVKELQAKWLNGKFYSPPRDEWNGTFKTPNEINGASISQIKNFITGQTDTGHQCRNRGCGLPTARCYNQLGHMSWCQYWIEEIGSPCGARCRNEKGYCELHTKLRPADFEMARQNRNAAELAEETTTVPAKQGAVDQLAGNPAICDQLVMGEKAEEDKLGLQEEGDQGRNEKTREKELQDGSIMEPGSSLAIDSDAVAGAEETEGQESPELNPKPTASVAVVESKPEYRKKREGNKHPTKATNKAKKQAEKKAAQEEYFKKSHGSAFKRKKGHE